MADGGAGSVEFDRLVSIFEADIRPLQAASNRAEQLIDNLQKKIESTKPFSIGASVGKGASGGDSAMRAAQADIARMQKKITDGEAAITRQVTKEAESQYKIKVQNYRKAVSDQLREIQKFHAAEAKASSGPSLFTQIIGGNLAATAILAVASAMRSGSSAILDYSSKLEQAKIGFTTMTGSADFAKQHLEDLQNFAKSTPFQFDELVDASQKMQGVGFAAQDVIPLLKDVGDILAGSGRMDAFGEAIKALGDIKSKGQLAGQEIIQLANAGIPIRAVLAKELGVSTEKLMKMGEEGQISAEMVFAALHKLAETKFGGAMEAQSKTFAGAMSNIHDAVMITAAKMFEPLYGKISHLAVDFGNEISKQQGDFEDVGNAIGMYIGAGLGLALEQVVAALAGYLAHRLSDIFSGKNIVDPLFKSIVSGLGKGIGIGADDTPKYAPVMIDQFGNVRSITEDIKKNVESTPSLSKKMEVADAAKRSAETNKRVAEIIASLTGDVATFGKESREAAVQQQLLAAGVTDLNAPLAAQAIHYAKIIDQLTEMKKVHDIVEDLNTQIRFFGDDSEVVATKQKLLAAGVKDFTSSSAQAALQTAAIVDQLKAAAEQDTKLKSLADHMKEMREDADKSAFEVKFPNATELDKFDRWAAGVRSGLSGARLSLFDFDADWTRLTLKIAASDKAELQVSGARQGILGALTDQMRKLEDQEPGFRGALADMLKQLDLVKTYTGAGGLDVTSETIASKLQTAITNYRKELAKPGSSDTFHPREDLKKALEEIQINTANGPDTIFKDLRPEYLDTIIDKLLATGDAFEGMHKKMFDAQLGQYTEEGMSRDADALAAHTDVLKAYGASTDQIAKAEMALAQKEEDIRHDRATKEIAFYRDSVMRMAETEEEKARILAQYNAQIESEDQRHRDATSVATSVGDTSVMGAWRKIGAQIPAWQEQFKGFARDIPSLLGNAFEQGLQNADGTWKGFLHSMYTSFLQTLQQMAMEIFKAHMTKLLINLGTSLFGSKGLPSSDPVGLGNLGELSKRGTDVFGAGGIGGGFFAQGGVPPMNRVSLVGEHGPELFIPNVGGRILSHDDSMQALGSRGGGTTIINNTVNQTFKGSRSLVAPKSVRQQTGAAMTALMQGSRGRQKS